MSTSVQLGYAYGDNKPDDVISVDDALAKQLIKDGIARVPDPKPTAKKADAKSD